MEENRKASEDMSRVTRSEKKNRKAPKNKNKKKKSLPKRIIKVVMITGLSVSVLTGGATAIGGYYAWDKYGETVQNSVTKGYQIAETVKDTDFVTKSPTKIVDKDGNVLKVFKEYQYETPEFDAINPFFKEALVSAEDERFYEHHGVDLYGTLRGIASTVKGNGVQGGSTITQQLVRNVILENSDVTIERKLIEQVVSQELEKKMGKDEILRHYLSNVYFGNGNYGIAPASKYYFSKDQKDIAIHEAATIIGITNNPSVFDPIRNPESSLKKRNRVLGKMLEAGVITKKEHESAINEPLGIKVTPHGLDNSVTEPALGYAVQKATEHLMEKNGFVFQYIFADDEARSAYKQRYHEEFMKVRESLMNGGYYIETSIDPKKQEALKKVVERVMSPYTAKDKTTGFYQLQTAIATTDNATGEVVAIVGGRGEDGNIFNRGFQGVRQPGSTIKPVVAYTPAYERGYTPDSRMVDSYIPKGPSNVYEGYMGNVSLRKAVELSINTVAYKLANQLGGQAMVEKMAKMKFSSLAPADSNPIISVGGFTYGVTSVEMASAFATISNQGVFKDPSNVRAIKDIVTDEVLYEREDKGRKVYESGASYLMVDTLKTVMTNGTGAKGMPDNVKHVIGKTGTTNANKDVWFVGGTPQYATSVWTGKDTPKSLTPNEKLVASALFKEWNENLHKGVKQTDFKRPDTVWKKNGRWVTSVKQVEKDREKRKYADTIRRDAEKAAQLERLELEDYRILHGLTKEEEEKREKAVEDAFQTFYDTPFDTLEEYEGQLQMLEAIEPLIKQVKHRRAVLRFEANYEKSMARITAKRDAFLAEIERQRLEEERKKREAEEAIRLEEERKIQEEIDRRIQEELEIRLAEEAEKQRLEEELKQQEEIEAGEEQPLPVEPPVQEELPVEEVPPTETP